MSFCEEYSVVCPYCHELVSFELVEAFQGVLYQDCEVCCRPWRVRIVQDPEGEPSVIAERSDG